MTIITTVMQQLSNIYRKWYARKLKYYYTAVYILKNELTNFLWICFWGYYTKSIVDFFFFLYIGDLETIEKIGSNCGWWPTLETMG